MTHTSYPYESNNIADFNYDPRTVKSQTVTLDHPDLVRVDRVRLLTDPGCPFYDVSYVYGTLKNGDHVRVDLGRHQFSRRRPGDKTAPSLKSQLIDCARRAGVNGKRLHLLDSDVISILF